MLAKDPAARPHIDAVLEGLAALATGPEAVRALSSRGARRRNTDPTVQLPKLSPTPPAARRAAPWWSRAAAALGRAARGLVGSDVPA
jgi:hypothetical protein